MKRFYRDHPVAPPNELDVAAEEARMIRENLEKSVSKGLTLVPPQVPGWKLRAMPETMYDAIGDVVVERARQDEKWGSDRDLDVLTYLAILGEEVGEVCKAIAEGDEVGLRMELAQVAAVSVAWLEMYLRQAEKDREFSENFAEMEALRAELERTTVAVDFGTEPPAVVMHTSDGTVRSLS